MTVSGAGKCAPLFPSSPSPSRLPSRLSCHLPLQFPSRISFVPRNFPSNFTFFYNIPSIASCYVPLLCLPLSYLDLAKAIIIKLSKDKLLANERCLFTIELMLINLLILLTYFLLKMIF